jgi:hypothetical protein
MEGCEGMLQQRLRHSGGDCSQQADPLSARSQPKKHADCSMEGEWSAVRLASFAVRE